MENIIRLYSHSGLCNRLRLISSYREKSMIENKPIEMHWIESVQCWKRFSDLFHPVSGVDFVYRKHGRNMRKTRPENSSISLCPISDENYNRFLLDIKPLPAIQIEIDKLSNIAGENFGACHVRRTDIITIQKKYKKTPPTNEDFFNFIEENNFDKVILATDNQETQDIFKKKLGDKIILTTNISGNGSKRWPKRTTDVRRAVVDLFLCINSYKFMGTVCSSFSDFIEGYREGLRCQTKSGVLL
tara:strand:+ start:1400 stop:2131 length:732 start_codon:yes stop_codon:yes gene_type:complete